MLYTSVQADMKTKDGYVVTHDGAYIEMGLIEKGEKLFKLNGKYFFFDYEATEYALKTATDEEFISFARDMQDKGRNGFKRYLMTFIDRYLAAMMNDDRSAKEILLKLAKDFAKAQGHNTPITFGEWLSDMRAGILSDQM